MPEDTRGAPVSGAEESLLSIIVPVYNEEEVIEAFYHRIQAVLDGLDMATELLFVNDGSSDKTVSILEQLCTADPRIGLINLSRNFGKEIAMTAGFDHARGDAVVVIDADLQDPPELIPELVQHWQQGCDVVYARRTARESESWLKKTTAHGFYRFMKYVSRVPILEDTGDFRLLSRRAVDALNQLREQHRFMKGLYAWIGYEQRAVPYRRNPRYAGKTKWNYWALWNFAIEGITSFTEAPLKIAMYLGLLTALGAFMYGVFVIVKTLLFGDPVAGYPSLMVAILFLGGVQLVAIGIIGEYLGRMFTETKHRPLYLVQGYQAARLPQPLPRNMADAPG